MKKDTRKPAPRRRPTQERARATCEAVLDATVKIAHREGLDAITTNRVAEVAGVSIGSLYQYFPNKDAIFEALHHRHAEESEQLIAALLVEHASSSLEHFLLAVFEALVDLHARDPALHELLGRQIPHRAHGQPGLSSALRDVISARAGELSPELDLSKLLFVVPNMIDTLAHEAVLCRPPHLSLAAAKDEAARTISTYLRAAPHGTARVL